MVKQMGADDYAIIASLVRDLSPSACWCMDKLTIALDILMGLLRVIRRRSV